MNVKLDTKEKFIAMEVLEPGFSVNMADAFSAQVAKIQQQQPPHLLLNLTAVNEIDAEMATLVANLQSDSYKKGHSFVICCLNPSVESVFRSLQLIEDMNITPTLSEAWDIIQMEEIERELLSNFDDSEI